MEEEPAMAVPDTEQEQNFIIETSSAPSKEVNEESTSATSLSSEVLGDDEFDLSDISHKEKTREEIIAEAEAAAFAEE